jgi:serine/threonine-protein kinase
VSRDGAFESLGRRDQYSHPRVSPDGGTIAVSVRRGTGEEVLLIDTMRGTMTRLTRDGSDATPAWRPDGRALALSSVRGGTRGILLKDLDGGERFLVETGGLPGFLRNMSWTPDGRQLAYTRQTSGGHDVWLLTIDDPSSPQALLDNPWSEHSPRVSPDGRWLAYVSDESGRQEIWVQRFPRGERRRASENGGSGPIWSRDGRELYFQGAGDGTPRLMMVTVETAGEVLRLGESAPLLNLRVTAPTGIVEQYGRSNNMGPMFDVLSDGRFVMVRGADPLGTREIVIVQHFGEDARRLTTRP